MNLGRAKLLFCHCNTAESGNWKPETDNFLLAPRYPIQLAIYYLLLAIYYLILIHHCFYNIIYPRPHF